MRLDSELGGAKEGAHLVGCGLNPVVLVAQSDDVRDFPRLIVADTESLEKSLLVKIVHGLERLLVGSVAIRGV